MQPLNKALDKTPNPLLSKVEDFFDTQTPEEEEKKSMVNEINQLIAEARKEIKKSEAPALEKALKLRQLTTLYEINNSGYTHQKDLISFFATANTLLKDIQPKEPEDKTNTPVNVFILSPGGGKTAISTSLGQIDAGKIYEHRD